MTALICFCTCPDAGVAERIAAALVDERLAACVSVLPGIASIYRWQGKVESATEIPLFIKSTAANYPALEKAIAALHPHEVPEIIALPIAQGLPAYLNWLAAETIQ